MFLKLRNKSILFRSAEINGLFCLCPYISISVGLIGDNCRVATEESSPRVAGAPSTALLSLLLHF